MVTKWRELTDGTKAEANFEDAEDVTRVERVGSHHRLGRSLAQARREKKLTQRQVAKLARVDQGQVSEVERGVGNPTLRILIALANAVGLDVDLRPLPTRRPVLAVDSPQDPRDPEPE
ncbi:MAG: helix-turn-helix transcriptional regulator [Polyangiaceae bacterium]